MDVYERGVGLTVGLRHRAPSPPPPRPAGWGLVGDRVVGRPCTGGAGASIDLAGAPEAPRSPRPITYVAAIDIPVAVIWARAADASRHAS